MLTGENEAYSEQPWKLIPSTVLMLKLKWLIKKNQELLSRSSRLAYPIRDGIPVMLPEEARELSADEVEKL